MNATQIERAGDWAWLIFWHVMRIASVLICLAVFVWLVGCATTTVYSNAPPCPHWSEAEDAELEHLGMLMDQGKLILPQVYTNGSTGKIEVLYGERRYLSIIGPEGIIPKLSHYCDAIEGKPSQ